MGQQLQWHQRHKERNWIVLHQEKQLFLRQKYRQRPSSFAEPLPYKQVAYLSLHQLGSHCSLRSGNFWDTAPTQLLGQPKQFSVAFPHKWSVLAHAEDFPKISQMSNICSWHTPYLSLSGPRTGTSSRKTWFAAWPLLYISWPSTICSHLQITL